MSPVSHASTLLAAVCLLAGCGAPSPRGGSTGTGIEAHVERDPAGPAELEALDMLCGSWEALSTTSVAGTGESFQGVNRSRVRWAAGGHVLLEESSRELGPYGTASDLGVWSWDDDVGSYLYWRFNSLGARESGVVRYEPDERVWYLDSKTVGADGTRTQGSGTMSFLDDNTKDFRWVGLDASGKTVLYEVTGTSRRR